MTTTNPPGAAPWDGDKCHDPKCYRPEHHKTHSPDTPDKGVIVCGHGREGLCGAECPAPPSDEGARECGKCGHAMLPSGRPFCVVPGCNHPGLCASGRAGGGEAVRRLYCALFGHARFFDYCGVNGFPGCGLCTRCGVEEGRAGYRSGLLRRICKWRSL